MPPSPLDTEGRSLHASSVQRWPSSLADGDRQPDLGHVGDRHLEEVVQDGEGPPVPWSVGYGVVTPTIQGEWRVPRWSAIADLDGERPHWIGSRVARAGGLRHSKLPRLHVAQGHEVEQAVEAAKLQGPEQGPVAPRVARAYVDQDEVPGVVGSPGVERRPLGFAQDARVIIGDDHTAADPTLELVLPDLVHVAPAIVFL